MKILFFVLSFLFLGVGSFAQNNYELFKKLFKENDSVKIEKLLTDWEKSNPNDPERYVSAMNYYFLKSKKEVLSISQVQRNNNDVLEIKDSSGKVVGYMDADFSYDPAIVGKALSYANEAIVKFPNRLDIRFGKCYILKEIGDYKNFSKELVNTIEYSRTNKNMWLWSENEKTTDGESRLINTTYDCLAEIYNTENDNLLPYLKTIGDSMLKYYPDVIEILSITAVAHLLTDSMDKALAYLLHAEQLNPKDVIVLNNIAEVYKRKGDKASTRKYYEKVLQYGDENAKADIKEKIKQLDKNP